MQKIFGSRYAGAFALGSMLLLAAAPLTATAQAASEKTHSHAHDHSEKTKDIYNGYFEDDQVKARPLADWEGEWQSVYPYLLDGTLDPVMAHKAEHGEKTAAEYRAYYDAGYRTDVDRIDIAADKITFHRKDAAVSGQYAADGQEVLTYEKGNRGVRFVFKKSAGDETAPDFIQFSDHKIAPEKSGHYHLYWGNDRAALLKEVTHWPTYYPASLDGKQILDEMLHH